MKTKTITYLDEIAQHIIAFFFGYTVIPIILKIIK